MGLKVSSSARATYRMQIFIVSVTERVRLVWEKAHQSRADTKICRHSRHKANDILALQ